jgi:hypothetical protein
MEWLECHEARAKHGTGSRRITHGHFRLLHRPFVQMERILRINELSVMTEDGVEAARSTLVIGAT